MGRRIEQARFIIWVPIASHVQKEETLRARVATRQERPPVVEPTIPAGATRPHTPFDLERVVPRFGDATDKSAVPPISIPSFGEDTCAAFEVSLLRAANSSSADVSGDHKVLHALRSVA